MNLSRIPEKQHFLNCLVKGKTVWINRWVLTGVCWEGFGVQHSWLFLTERWKAQVWIRKQTFWQFHLPNNVWDVWFFFQRRTKMIAKSHKLPWRGIVVLWLKAPPEGFLRHGWKKDCPCHRRAFKNQTTVKHTAERWLQESRLLVTEKSFAICVH